MNEVNDWFDQLLFGFRFESPWLLWALLLLPFWAWLRGRYAPVAAVQFSSAKLLKAASRMPRFGRGRMLVVMRLSALNLMIIALARPQMERGVTEQEVIGINIAAVLDFTNTMATRDLVLDRKRVSRAEAMKAVIGEFIRGRPNDYLAAVRFDAGAHLVSPLTRDHDWLLTQLAYEEPGQEKGSAPGSGMLIATEALQTGGEQPKVMITLIGAAKLSEGPRLEQVARTIAPMGIRNHIIQLADFTSRQESAGTAALLQGVARSTGGQFFQASDVPSLRSVLEKIDHLEQSAFNENRQKRYRELMGWFAWPAVLILLVELMMTHWVWRRLP